GQLGDDAAEVFVRVDLRMNDVGQDPAATLNQRDRSFVAGRLYAERQCQLDLPIRRYAPPSPHCGEETSLVSSANPGEGRGRPLRSAPGWLRMPAGTAASGSSPTT